MGALGSLARKEFVAAEDVAGGAAIAAAGIAKIWTAATLLNYSYSEGGCQPDKNIR